MKIGLRIVKNKLRNKRKRRIENKEEGSWRRIMKEMKIKDKMKRKLSIGRNWERKESNGKRKKKKGYEY